MGGYRSTDPVTCRLAFEAILADGTLKGRRLEAVRFLSEQTKLMTAGEMAREMKTNRNNLATRLSELEHLGVVEKGFEKECEVSKKICFTWVMTNKLPEGEIPKNINTTEIVRGQRNRAMKASGELSALLLKVVDWLESSRENKSQSQCNKAAERIKRRVMAITGETK